MQSQLIGWFLYGSGFCWGYFRTDYITVLFSEVAIAKNPFVFIYVTILSFYFRAPLWVYLYFLSELMYMYIHILLWLLYFILFVNSRRLFDFKNYNKIHCILKTETTIGATFAVLPRLFWINECLGHSMQYGSLKMFCSSALELFFSCIRFDSFM